MYVDTDCPVSPRQRHDAFSLAFPDKRKGATRAVEVLRGKLQKPLQVSLVAVVCDMCSHSCQTGGK